MALLPKLQNQPQLLHTGLHIFLSFILDDIINHTMGIRLAGLREIPFLYMDRMLRFWTCFLLVYNSENTMFLIV